LAPATWFEGRTRTWAELDRLTTELAAGLIDVLGVRPGERVAILDQNSDDYLALLYACDKAGAVATPLNWRLTGREVGLLAVDAEAVCVVAGDEFRAAADSAGVRVLGFDELPRVVGAPDPHRDDESRVFWQLYTSGTTGLPKGAMITGHNLFSTISNFGIEMPEMRAGARCLVPMPLYHTGGCGWCTAVLLFGGTAVIMRDLEPERVLRTIVEQEVEVGFVVPSLLRAMTRTDYARGADFSKLAAVIYGASPIALPVLEEAIATFACRFVQVYGLTETTGPITFLQHEDHRGDRLLSCGRASFGSELRIVDADGDELLPGEIVEIVYRGQRGRVLDDGPQTRFIAPHQAIDAAVDEIAAASRRWRRVMARRRSAVRGVASVSRESSGLLSRPVSRVTQRARASCQETRPQARSMRIRAWRSNQSQSICRLGGNVDDAAVGPGDREPASEIPRVFLTKRKPALLGRYLGVRNRVAKPAPLSRFPAEGAVHALPA